MPDPRLPLVIEPRELEAQLGRPDLLIIDLTWPEQYHVPGSVFLDYSQLVAARPPVMGLLPDENHLRKMLSGLGLTPETHVVAYDEEGGGKAARLFWTLDLVRHPHYSLLNGGLHAWANEGHPLTDELVSRPITDYPLSSLDMTPLADRAFILEHLNDPSVILLDARSPEEYSGQKRFAAKGGHIPGAVNLEWTQGMDLHRNARLKPVNELRKLLEAKGVTSDKTIITYCQTHHRSSFTYFMLRVAGYPHVKGYPGSWSDWGNHPETPVE